MPKGIPKNGINKGWFKKGNKITLGYKQTVGAKKKIGDAKRGDKNPAKRPEVREKIRQTLLEHVVSEETRQKIRKKIKVMMQRPGVKENLRQKALKQFENGMPEKTRKKIGKSIEGEQHWNWQGGKSFEPYGLEFNEDLKEVIRNRDRRKCQLCEKTELENKEKLSVHHIDYDKQNNNPNNLISLCRKCHTKTSFSRKYWIKHFNYE